MKKILFSLAFVACFFTLNAQVVVWSDDFNDEDISDWTLYDEDGDGYNWLAFDPSTVTDLLSPGAIQCMVSYSYDDDTGESLTPDNWAVSEPIDLSGASGVVTLKWDVGSIATTDWLEDYYGVYVFPADLGELPATDTEVYHGGPIEQIDFDNQVVGNTVSVDISEYAGQPVRLAFRHYETFDMYTLIIDNVTIEAENLSVSDLDSKSVSVYPNPTSEAFTVNVSSKFNAQNVTVSLTNLAGKTVRTFRGVSSYNIAELPAGVYVVKISDGKNEESVKLIKK